MNVAHAEWALDLAARFADRAVLVVGDVILDRYLHGTVERISPEAPVPVVRLGGPPDLRPGGAANVAVNLRSLGARPQIVAVVGDDEAGAQLRELLATREIDAAGLIAVAGRPTTVKTRVLARHQQVVRLDQENDGPVADGVARAVVQRALAALPHVDALIVSDYAKGLLDERVLPELLRAAARAGVPSVIDPKIRHFPLYQPATVVTPNQAEAARATAREIAGEADVVAAAQSILERMDLGAVLVTRGEEGMLLLERGRPPVSIRAVAREVFDVTGAGDTVAAALGLGLAAGMSLETAARCANAAAAIAVGHLGTAAVRVEELEAWAARETP